MDSPEDKRGSCIHTYSFPVAWCLEGRACNGDADNGEVTKLKMKLIGVMIATGKVDTFLYKC